ncbi:tail fiber assembly protein [Salmonella enterica]|nr:tail fiber assembly protein [Salmonella enterica]
MMHMKNIVPNPPGTPEQRQLTEKFCVTWLFDEDGKNWYDEQKNFAADTLKIAYNKNGIIVSISKDVSMINPAGLSVVELPDISANRQADISGKWRFVDGVVSPVPVDYHKKAESQRQNLLDDANDTTADWRTELSLGIISDEDKACLVKWMTYIKALKALDLSDVKNEAGFKDINWPDKPEKPLTKQE